MAIPVAMAIPVVLLQISCGYHSSLSSLPQDASRLWIAPVQNKTAYPELDLRLRQHLQRQFARYPTIQLTKMASSQWILQTTLTNISRTYSVEGAYRRLTYKVKGQIALSQPATKTNGWGPKTIEAQHAITVENELENPAINDQALQQTLLQFASKVKDKLFVLSP